MAKKYQGDILIIYREEAAALLNLLQRESYRGVSGDLARSWTVRVKVFSFTVTSNDPAARWKIAGRGPGKPPPIKAIAPWANSKGISPYAVAMAIAQRGTERWRTQDNFLNMRRDGRFAKPNPMDETRLRISKRVSRLKFG